MKSRSRKRG
jgi:OTU domain-containing protein 3